mgnify:CR=1 FL=1
MIINVASFASKNVKVGPYFPIDFTPGNSVCFSNESNKFLEIPSSIYDVFCSNLSVIVDVRFGFVTVKNSPLVHCK